MEKPLSEKIEDWKRDNTLTYDSECRHCQRNVNSFLIYIKKIEKDIAEAVEELKKLKDKEGYYVFHWDDTKWILKEIDKILGGQDEKTTKGIKNKRK